MNRTSKSARTRRQVMLLLGVYHPQHHQGIARYAREAGWIVDQGHVDGTDEAPVWWRGDGMITLITRPKHYAAFRLMPKVPMVDLSLGWVSNAMPPRLRATGRGRPRVLEDNTAIGRLAAKHFLERGFQHVAFFNFGNWWLETERLPAFRRTVETAGARFIELPYHRHTARQPTNTVGQERRAHQWLVDTIRGLPKPAGIFAPTDDLALSVLRACGDAGVGTPEEVAVLGCDNIPLVCDFAPVPLSSVDPDLEGQGYEAARLLDRLMNGEPPPKEPILIPPRGVVTRQSTNILAVPHVPTARALRFIWEHYRERIRTPEVAAAAGLSRRGVEHSFRQHLRRSIAEEVARCRVEHARDLLLTTGMKAWQVAEAAGFSGIVDFSRVFKRVVGLAPHHYRRQHLAGGARLPRPSAARPAP